MTRTFRKMTHLIPGNDSFNLRGGKRTEMLTVVIVGSVNAALDYPVCFAVLQSAAQRSGCPGALRSARKRRRVRIPLQRFEAE